MFNGKEKLFSENRCSFSLMREKRISERNKGSITRKDYPIAILRRETSVDGSLIARIIIASE